MVEEAIIFLGLPTYCRMARLVKKWVENFFSEIRLFLSLCVIESAVQRRKAHTCCVSLLFEQKRSNQLTIDITYPIRVSYDFVGQNSLQLPDVNINKAKDILLFSNWRARTQV